SHGERVLPLPSCLSAVSCLRGPANPFWQNTLQPSRREAGLARIALEMFCGAKMGGDGACRVSRGRVSWWEVRQECRKDLGKAARPCSQPPTRGLGRVELGKEVTVAKRSLVPEAVERYVSEVVTRETPVQRRLRAETAALPRARMQIGPDQGAL